MERNTACMLTVWTFNRTAAKKDAHIQWEYKIVALGLIVDATEPKQREKHEQILNNLGSEGWEAVACVSQSDTVLLKRPVKQAADNEPK